jgi:DNA-binding transcriptional ArsR family regulator
VRGVEYIEAEDVRRHPFHVAITPLPSLNSALRDAAGAGRAGTPEPWCAAIRTHLRTRDYETLAPFVTAGPLLAPDPLMGLAKAPGESLKDGIERMMATPVDRLAEELEACDRFSPGTWGEAARDPGGWLRRYVAALLRGWMGFRPVWRQARSAIDREVERVGIASALDAQLELLDGLVSNGAVEDGHWGFSWGPEDRRVGIAPTGLVLMPMVAGERAFLVAGEYTSVGHLAYPVRSTFAPSPAEPPPAALEALLGAPRVQILRGLELPRSIGQLAEALNAVPSAATHHVGALEAAGLVTRERRGRQVMVGRTPRGEALLDLYDDIARSSVAARGRRSRPRGMRVIVSRGDLAS